MNRIALLIFILSFVNNLCLSQEATVPARFYRHKSLADRTLVSELGTLTFDDNRRTIMFKDDANDKLVVPYDSVDKALFETTEHMRGMTPVSFLAGAIPFAGMVAGPAVAGHHVSDDWFYLEYGSDPHREKVLLQLPQDKFASVINKANNLFEAKVIKAEYVVKGEQFDPSKLPRHKEKDELKIDKRNHPLPEIKPDKAVVVVLCPPVRGGYDGLKYQFKVHANDEVIAVNKWGTYSFAYLDPGKYRLASQSENAYWFEMELEAGKSYYFLQNTFQGVVKNQASLTRNSPELVSYLIDGSYYSDWRRK